MKNSVSNQSRKLVNHLINRINNNNINSEEEFACIKWAFDTIGTSYFTNSVKMRAALLLKRAIKSKKVYETDIAKENYRNWVKEIIEIYGFDPRYI